MATSSINNAWVDSYLSALLSAGLSTEHITDAELQAEKAEAVAADRQIAAKYYVQQVMSLDEDSIRTAWLKVGRKSSTLPTSEKDARLEYLSWRAWGMRRKRAAVQREEDVAAALQAAEAEISDELGGWEVAVDEDPEDAAEVSKLLRPGQSLRALLVDSESSGGDDQSVPESPCPPSSPSYAADSSLTADRVPLLHMVLISMHGLVRGEKMELGRDPDTGGQVKYVVELAKALARHPAVHRVDLLTRLIQDPNVAKDYGQPEEVLEAGEGAMGGAYIIRIPCGPTDQYLRKEALWPFVREFADNGLSFVKSCQQRMLAAGEPCELYAVHGHYADAGECAALMAHTLGVDMVLTGHSLGRNKLEHLLKSGSVSRKEIESTYAISRRIEGEERALDCAMMVFTSTEQEIRDQWGLYDGYNEQLERILRQRQRNGRHFPIMNAIPPGLDFSALKVDSPPDPFAQMQEAAAKTRALAAAAVSEAQHDVASPGDQADPPRLALNGIMRRSSTGTRPNSTAPSPGPGSPKAPADRLLSTSLSRRTSSIGTRPLSTGPSPAPGSPMAPPDWFQEDPPIWQQIFKFLRNPRKPVVLAMSRPDAKKNITTLVKAFGSNAALREIANLVLIMGNRDVIDSMAPGSQKVLGDVLKMIDAYNLYGSVSYPKQHTQADISDIYLLPKATHGVFVNIALQEPFGLTLIEAAAHGVPILATKNGGPVDIVHTLRNGVLVDPVDHNAVADELLKMLTNTSVWEEYSNNGTTLINAYSWPSHCIKYLRAIEAEKRVVVRRSKSALQTTISASLDDMGLRATLTGLDHETLSEWDFPVGSPDGHSRSASLDMARCCAPLLTGLDDSLLRRRGGGERLRLRSVKDKYVVYMLDGLDTADTLGQLLSKKGRRMLGMHADGAKLGTGIASMYTLTKTQELLEEAGLSLADLDFAITNGGSEIWYTGTTAGSALANTSSGAVMDDSYESHVEVGWDKNTVKSVLAQCLNSKSLLGRFLSPSKGAKGGPVIRPKLHVDTETGAHHQLVSWRHPTSADGGAAFGAHEQAALMARFQRKFRRSGLRCHLVLTVETSQPSSAAHGLGALVKLHVTPMRASRALALRWLTLRHDLEMQNVVLLCSASKVEGSVVGLAASDADEVFAGVQGVLVCPSRAAQGAAGVVDGKKQKSAFDGFTLDVGVFQHNGRLQVLA